MMHLGFKSKEARRARKQKYRLRQTSHSLLLVARQGDASRMLNQTFLLVDSFNFNFVDEERSDIYHSRLDTYTYEEERGEQLADEIDKTDYTIVSYNEATRLPTNGRSISPDISLATNDIALLSDWSIPPHLPAIIFPSSSQSTPNCPRMMGLGEPTSTSRKRNGNAMQKTATNTLLKLAKQKLSNKPRRSSG